MSEDFTKVIKIKIAQGIEFLYFAANPTNTKFLTDDEFSVSKDSTLLILDPFRVQW